MKKRARAESETVPGNEAVQWTAITALEETKKQKSGDIEVQVGTYTIKVPLDFHAETFREVCKELVSLC